MEIGGVMVIGGDGGIGWGGEGVGWRRLVGLLRVGG